jgi:glycosyltransferase involved in cell wall biosynthesis
VLSPVPPAQVIDYAASATIGVSPAVPASLNDAYSLPNKLFQYMAAGIPVLASDFPHIRDIVVPSGAGRTVDMTQPARVAAALRDMLSDPAALQQMGRSARAAVLMTYNWSTAERELLDVYAGLRASTGLGAAATER